MEKSLLNFKAANPNWQPTDHNQSLYLSRMTELNASMAPRRNVGAFRSSQQTHRKLRSRGRKVDVLGVGSRPGLEDDGVLEDQEAGMSSGVGIGGTIQEQINHQARIIENAKKYERAYQLSVANASNPAPFSKSQSKVPHAENVEISRTGSLPNHSELDDSAEEASFLDQESYVTAVNNKRFEPEFEGSRIGEEPEMPGLKGLLTDIYDGGVRKW
jgi:autophagy-related protein 9